MWGARTKDCSALEADLEEIKVQRFPEEHEAFQEMIADIRGLSHRWMRQDEPLHLTERTETATDNALRKIPGIAAAPSLPRVKNDLLAACNRIIDILKYVEDASEPGPWAFDISHRLRALRARTRAHGRQRTSLDFLIHAADLLLWEVEQPLDSLLYESRADALAMAFHRRLGERSALGSIGMDMGNWVLRQMDERLAPKPLR